MTQSLDPDTEPGVPVLADTDSAVPTVMRRTGQTERYVLQAAALRRRQLRAAFLYGSGRSWRQRQALWPAALAGLIAVAVIMAVIAVSGAFAKQNHGDAQPHPTEHTSSAT